MKLIALLALVLSSSTSWAQPGFVQVVVTDDTFDEQLSPYGSWLVIPGYGRVWQPGHDFVGEDFYPYGTSGRWVLTDAGWVFDSDLPFGWAVFHYGRWMLDDDYGWVWVPGNTWAPAWVSWRTGGTYVGWAPMGPRGAPRLHRSSWLFVETGHLTVVNVRSRAVDERRFRDATTMTQPVHGAVPIGPPAAYITAATRREIRAVPVNTVRGSSRMIPPPPPPSAVRREPQRQRNPGAPPPPPQQQIEPDRRFNSPPAPPPPQQQQNRQLAPPPPPQNRQLAPPPPQQQQNRQFAPPPPPPQQQQNRQLAPPPPQQNRQLAPPPPPRSASPGQPPPPPGRPRSQQGPPPPPGKGPR